MDVCGICDPRFSAVKEAFVRNFEEHGEVGAAVCVIQNGQTVVDLWGGRADPATGRPWRQDTLSVIFSCSKGAVALCALVLFDRGLLDFEAPVTTYWPEFGQNGKEHVTVGMLLNHTSGLPAFRQPLKQHAFYDWDYMVDALATEAPFWDPGSQVGYHSFNIGWLGGELVRRVDGRPFDRFFREEIAEPLNLDFWFGVPASYEARVAKMLPMVDHPLHLAVTCQPESIAALQILNSGGFAQNEEHNLPISHRACLPAQGGITNARGLAGMYAPLSLGGSTESVRLVDEETVRLMGRVSSSTECDLVLGKPYRYSFGFMKSGSWIKSPTTFGHPGAGGSIGFADPNARLAFGYVMNQQNHDPARRQSLVDAVYESLDGGLCIAKSRF
ncbi:MAG: serine hydrolase domain-containing protein [Nitrolancea sp.]